MVSFICSDHSWNPDVRHFDVTFSFATKSTRARFSFQRSHCPVHHGHLATSLVSHLTTVPGFLQLRTIMKLHEFKLSSPKHIGSHHWLLTAEFLAVCGNSQLYKVYSSKREQNSVVRSKLMSTTWKMMLPVSSCSEDTLPVSFRKYSFPRGIHVAIHSELSDKSPLLFQPRISLATTPPAKNYTVQTLSQWQECAVYRKWFTSV